MSSARDCGGSKGGKTHTKAQDVKITKTKEMLTTRDFILRLRAALFNEDGTDKDVFTTLCKGFIPFKRNGLNLECSFLPSKALTRPLSKALFNLLEKNIKEKYIESGLDFSEEDFLDEFSNEASRFIIVKDLDIVDRYNVIAFVHFRFTVQGEVFDDMIGDPCVFIYDIHVQSEYQSKGVGKHLMQICEFIAKKQDMDHVMLTLPKASDRARSFFFEKCQGYGRDEMDYEEGIAFAEDECSEVITKKMTSKPKALSSEKQEVQDLASLLALQMQIKEQNKNKEQNNNNVGEP